MMMTATVDVGWTSQYPLIPEQHVSRVTVSVPLASLDRADLWAAENDARLLAAKIVGANGSAVMPTSSTIVSIEV